MKKSLFEFSRPLEIQRVPANGCVEKLAADPAECAAIAARLGVPAIHAFSGALKAEHWRSGGLRVQGQYVLSIEQVCVVTLENFTTLITRPVERFYLLPRDLRGIDPEGEDADVDPVHDGRVDLGEMLVECVALELDAYPRKPGAVFVGDTEAAEAHDPPRKSPFSALADIEAPPIASGKNKSGVRH